MIRSQFPWSKLIDWTNIHGPFIETGYCQKNRNENKVMWAGLTEREREREKIKKTAVFHERSIQNCCAILRVEIHAKAISSENSPQFLVFQTEANTHTNTYAHSSLNKLNYRVEESTCVRLEIGGFSVFAMQQSLSWILICMFHVSFWTFLISNNQLNPLSLSFPLSIVLV